MEETTELDNATLKRRLRKALTLAEKLKKRNVLEGDVNTELAKRNELMKKEILCNDERLIEAKALVVNLEKQIQNLVKFAERLIQSQPRNNKVDLEKELQLLKQPCFQSCDHLKNVGLAMTVELAAIAAAKIAEEQREFDRRNLQRSINSANNDSNFDKDHKITNRTRRNSSMFIHLPELSGTSLLRKSVDGVRVSDKKSRPQGQHPYHAYAAQHQPVSTSLKKDNGNNNALSVSVDFTVLHDPHRQKLLHLAQRQQSHQVAASKSRPRAKTTLSTTAVQRTQKLYTDVINNDKLLDTSDSELQQQNISTTSSTSLLLPSSELASEPFPVDVKDHTIDKDDSKQIIDIVQEVGTAVTVEDVRGKDDVEEEQQEVEEDLTSSSGGGGDSSDDDDDDNYSPSHSTQSSSQSAASNVVPLFEHFVVVGAPSDVATEFAHQIRLHSIAAAALLEEELNSSLASRWKRTLGGFLSNIHMNNTSNHGNSSSNYYTTSNHNGSVSSPIGVSSTHGNNYNGISAGTISITTDSRSNSSTATTMIQSTATVEGRNSSATADSNLKFESHSNQQQQQQITATTPLIRSGSAGIFSYFMRPAAPSTAIATGAAVPTGGSSNNNTTTLSSDAALINSSTIAHASTTNSSSSGNNHQRTTICDENDDDNDINNSNSITSNAIQLATNNGDVVSRTKNASSSSVLTEEEKLQFELLLASVTVDNEEDSSFNNNKIDNKVKESSSSTVAWNEYNDGNSTSNSNVDDEESYHSDTGDRASFESKTDAASSNSSSDIVVLPSSQHLSTVTSNSNTNSIASTTTLALSRFGGAMLSLSRLSTTTTTAATTANIIGGGSSAQIPSNTSSNEVGEGYVGSVGHHHQHNNNHSTISVSAGTGLTTGLTSSTLTNLSVNSSSSNGSGNSSIFVNNKQTSTKPDSSSNHSIEKSLMAPNSATTTSIAYVENTAAAKLICTSDKLAGRATTKADMLYRYPPTVEPPPQEVCDFCLPLGGKLNKLMGNHDSDNAAASGDTSVQEILFGHNHSKRSGRCFVFLLEDKTLVDEVGDEETGVGTGKLYGICVLHPRLIRTPILLHEQQNATAKQRLLDNNSSSSSHGSGSSSTDIATLQPLTSSSSSEYIEFESMVCYAFLTRFPLFDFFFQVIFDMITTERLYRMERAVDQSDADLSYSRSHYQYLPSDLLDDVLARLTFMKPPLYGEKYHFRVSPGILPIQNRRDCPPVDSSEHYRNASEWALPTLLAWMPAEAIVWALGLLMNEAKLVVIGQDYGLVSCAVMGLLVLLRPLDWVAPVIPMLPVKLMDFVESPVPILVGLTVDEGEKVITVESIFQRCSDTSDDGIILAVMDIGKREVFLSNNSATKAVSLQQLCLPNAHILAQQIQSCLLLPQQQQQNGNSSNNSPIPLQQQHHRRPQYALSETQREATRAAHDVTTEHIIAITAQAMNEHVKLVEKRKEIIELAEILLQQKNNNVSNHHHVKKKKDEILTSKLKQSSISPLFPSNNNCSDDDDDDGCDDNNTGVFDTKQINGDRQMTTLKVGANDDVSKERFNSMNRNSLLFSSINSRLSVDDGDLANLHCTTVMEEEEEEQSNCKENNNESRANEEEEEEEDDLNNEEITIAAAIAALETKHFQPVACDDDDDDNGDDGGDGRVISNNNNIIALSQYGLKSKAKTTEQFLQRFISTQIFSEYLHSQLNEEEALAYRATAASAATAMAAIEAEIKRRKNTALSNSFSIAKEVSTSSLKPLLNESIHTTTTNTTEMKNNMNSTTEFNRKDDKIEENFVPMADDSDGNNSGSSRWATRRVSLDNCEEEEEEEEEEEDEYCDPIYGNPIILPKQRQQRNQLQQSGEQPSRRQSKAGSSSSSNNNISSTPILVMDSLDLRRRSRDFSLLRASTTTTASSSLPSSYFASSSDEHVFDFNATKDSIEQQRYLRRRSSEVSYSTAPPPPPPRRVTYFYESDEVVPSTLTTTTTAAAISIINDDAIP